MAIRSILAPITGLEPSHAPLESGMRIARLLDAFIDVLHVRQDPREAISLIAMSGSGVVLDQLMGQMEKETESRATQARRLFEKAAQAAGIAVAGSNATGRFRTIVASAPDEVPVQARVADLILFCRLPEGVDTEWRLTLETALVGSGRAVLLLPLQARPTVGKTVALAWNGSAEAARAFSAALPILKLAQKVLLLFGTQGPPVTPSLSEVGDWLGRHGIATERQPVALKGWPVGEQLVEEAAGAGADLLVMGAYGHTRVRETIFGGATRAVLNESALPVLLAH
jgi:nucleotide-binding universal stress UspA family protein